MPPQAHEGPGAHARRRRRGGGRASRPATAPSSTSPTRSPRLAIERARGGASRRLSALRRPPGLPAHATRRPRSTSSASPPASTRWCPARARSSARCAPRTRPARPGPLLDRLFRQALHAGKKVRTETGDRARARPPSRPPPRRSRQQVFDDLRGRRDPRRSAPGRSSELTARSLASRGAEISFVANRTLDRAEELARALRRRAAAARARRRRSSSGPTSSSPRRARRATSSTAPRWSARCARAAGARCSSIDLAVPRDLDPAIHELDGCYLYDIDDLEAVVAETVAGRRREAVRAEAIVAEEAERFRAWQASLEVVPAIASLRARAEEIRARRARAGRGAARAALGRRAPRRRGGHGRRSSTSSCTCRPCA